MGELLDILSKTLNNSGLRGEVAPRVYGINRTRQLAPLLVGGTGRDSLLDEEEINSMTVGQTWDPYTRQKGSQVSTELVLEDEFDMKDEFDARILAQNLGWETASINGLRPCDLLEGSRKLRRLR